MCHGFKLWSKIAIIAAIMVLNCSYECNHGYGCGNCRYCGHCNAYCNCCVIFYFFIFLQLGIEPIVAWCSSLHSWCGYIAINLRESVSHCNCSVMRLQWWLQPQYYGHIMRCGPQFETMATILLLWSPSQSHRNGNYGRISYIFPQFSISQCNYNRNLKPWYVLILNR